MPDRYRVHLYRARASTQCMQQHCSDCAHNAVTDCFFQDLARASYTTIKSFHYASVMVSHVAYVYVFGLQGDGSSQQDGGGLFGGRSKSSADAPTGPQKQKKIGAKLVDAKPAFGDQVC